MNNSLKRIIVPFLMSAAADFFEDSRLILNFDTHDAVWQSAQQLVNYFRI